LRKPSSESSTFGRIDDVCGRSDHSRAPSLTLLIFAALATCVAPGVARASSDDIFLVLKPVASDRVEIRSYRDINHRIKIEISGDRYDGRRLIKAMISQLRRASGDGWLRDADLAIHVGTFIGFGGETFRGLSLHLSISAGRIHEFLLKSESGLDLVGKLGSDFDGRRTIELESGDAGSLFRALDLSGRTFGGRMSLTLDADNNPQGARVGQMTLRDYSVSYETFFDNTRRYLGPVGNGSVAFFNMQMTFKLSAGQIVIDRGYACNSFLLTEMRGKIDLTRNDVNISGNFILAFGRKLDADLPSEGAPNFPMFLHFSASGSIRTPTTWINQSDLAVLARPLLRSCFAPSLPTSPRD
jgi:hypothetical protein